MTWPGKVAFLEKKSLKRNNRSESKLRIHSSTVCHVFLQVPAAFMNVLEEKLLKRKRVEAKPKAAKINLFYFLFWTSLYQLLTAALLFWIDIVPYYGQAENITAFKDQ